MKSARKINKNKQIFNIDTWIDDGYDDDGKGKETERNLMTMMMAIMKLQNVNTIPYNK